jgi:outer membrane protein insertion porin family/translocation and assembly module TamA
LPVLVLFIAAGAGCREDGVRVRSLGFDGVSAVDEGELRQALATRAGSWIPFTRKPAFDADEFERDVQRLRAFYVTRGYPDARVTDVDVVFDDKKETVALTVTVREGEPVRVESVRFEGFDGLLTERRRAALTSRAGLERGGVRNRLQVEAARTAAQTLLNEIGHPYAEVRVHEESAETPRRALLVFEATPGPRATFGEVEIQGNVSVSDEVIRRQLAFRPGQRYRGSRLQASQSRLTSLELFSFAHVEPRPGSGQPDETPIRVTVAEDKHRRFTGAIGYGTEEKARVRAAWRHVNFLGGARTVGVESKWSSLDRGVRVSFDEPWFFTRHLAFSAQGQVWDEREPVYRVASAGGRVGVAWKRMSRDPLTRRPASTSIGVSFLREYTDYRVSDQALADPSMRPVLIALGLDPDTGSSTGTLAALRVEAMRETVDSRLDAHRGYVVSAAIERAGSLFGGAFDYTEVSGEGRAFYSTRRGRFRGAGDRGVVFAQRVRAATIVAHDIANQPLPFFKRYFLGGSTSLRGWGRYEVSPLTESGQPVGGITLLEASSEIRVPIGDKLTAVAFVDAGGVGVRTWRLEDQLRVNVGPGLRYATPIGPIRFDLGYQLNPIPNLMVDGTPQTRRWRVHLSIGQAF